MKHSRHLFKNIGARLLLGGSLLAPVTAGAAQAADASEVEAAFRKTLVQRCEKRWTKNFVPMAKAQLPATDPLNDESRVVVLDVVADRKGKVIAAEVATSSGATPMDEAAKEVALDTGPFPKLPGVELSDDGNLHLLWVFARADGRCDDVQIHDARLPPEQAIVALLSQGRQERAWQRLTEAVAEGNEKAVGLYARHWLKRASKDAKVGLLATAALAEGGDREAAAQVAALAEAGTLPAALWQTLPRAGLAVCKVAKKALNENKADARLAALRALEVHLDKDCLGPVVAVAVNAAAPVAERVAALKVLAASDADEARAAAKRAMDDSNIQVRAAAMRSWGQSDTGRKALFALTLLLKDKSAVIRAAANAGVARSSGDKGLEQLYLVFKEKDPQIFEALSQELAQMTTEASAEMLRKFVRRDDVRIRRAAAMALASRSDKFARAAVATLAVEVDPGMKLLAAQALPIAEVKELANRISADPKLSAQTFQALLGGGARQAAATLMLEVLPKANDGVRIEWLKGWLGTAEPQPKVVSSQP